MGVADRFEALSAGRGTTAADGGEGILETGPGAEILMFFVIHKARSASIDAERRGGLSQTGQLAPVTGIDRCQPTAFRRLFAPSPNFSVAREGGGAGREKGGKSEFGVCFVGDGKIRKRCHRVGGLHPR